MRVILYMYIDHLFTPVVISYNTYEPPMKSYTKGKNVTREELTRQSHISTHSIMMTRQQKRWLSELTESKVAKHEGRFSKKDCTRKDGGTRSIAVLQSRRKTSKLSKIISVQKVSSGMKTSSYGDVNLLRGQ